MKIAIIGGGAAGLFCAANLPSNDVTVFESTNSCGNKLLLTGGGRCNYTNTSVNFFDGVVDGSKFLRSSISNFGPSELINWFNSHGMATHHESTRAFPITQSSKSVLDLLIKICKQNNVKFKLNCPIKNIEPLKSGGYKIMDNNFDAVVVATGGKTFPKTGSDGNGNSLLNKLGLQTNEFSPKLGAIYAQGTSQLQGVSVNAKVSLISNNKVVAQKIGPIIFTHFGLSGPAVLDCSGLACDCNMVQIDFLPSTNSSELQQSLINARNGGIKQNISTYLSKLLPKSVAKFIESKCECKKLNELSNKSIAEIIENIKKCNFKFLHFSSFDQSWVSAGGAKLSQINPTTMESKTNKNLFVIGEQLDVFGLCGGYNLQIAFSTAKAVADYLEGAKK